MKMISLFLFILFPFFTDSSEKVNCNSQVWGLKYSKSETVLGESNIKTLVKCISEYKSIDKNPEARFNWGIICRITSNKNEDDSIKFNRIKSMNDFFRQEKYSKIPILFRIENEEKSDIRFLNTTLGNDSVYGAIIGVYCICD